MKFSSIIITLLLIIVMGCAQQYSEINLLHKQADQGDANAHYQLGIIYREGRGVPVSYASARSHFTEAVRLGHPTARQNLSEVNDTMNIYPDQFSATEHYEKVQAELSVIEPESQQSGNYYGESKNYRSTDSEFLSGNDFSSSRNNTDNEWKKSSKNSYDHMNSTPKREWKNADATPTNDIGSSGQYLDTRTSTMKEGLIKVAPNEVWDPVKNTYHTLDGNGDIVD